MKIVVIPDDSKQKTHEVDTACCFMAAKVVDKTIDVVNGKAEVLYSLMFENAEPMDRNNLLVNVLHEVASLLKTSLTDDASVFTNIDPKALATNVDNVLSMFKDVASIENATKH